MERPDVDELYALLRRPEWHARAACRGLDGDLWFPERGESLAPARAICATCTVRPECLEAGIGEHFGVFGGLSERERRQERSRRRRKAAA